jgi:hypothetical protein
MNNFYSTPDESFPMSTETAEQIENVADIVYATGKKLSAKYIRQIAERAEVTSEDIRFIYRKENAINEVSPTAAQALYELRMDLAQPFANTFYKNPETGIHSPAEEEDED